MILIQGYTYSYNLEAYFKLFCKPIGLVVAQTVKPLQKALMRKDAKKNKIAITLVMIKLILDLDVVQMERLLLRDQKIKDASNAPKR